jgi:hypothetical protein
MSSLVVVNAISVLPSDPSRKQLELHAWLQGAPSRTVCLAVAAAGAVCRRKSAGQWPGCCGRRWRDRVLDACLPAVQCNAKPACLQGKTQHACPSAWFHPPHLVADVACPHPRPHSHCPCTCGPFACPAPCCPADFAWMEADLPRKLAARPVLPSQPMFCVETALKMLAWSWVVYLDEPQEEEGSEAKGEESGAEKAGHAGEAGGLEEGEEQQQQGGNDGSNSGGGGAGGRRPQQAAAKALASAKTTLAKAAAVVGVLAGAQRGDCTCGEPPRGPPQQQQAAAAAAVATATGAAPPAAAAAAGAAAAGAGAAGAAAPVEEVSLDTALSLYRLQYHHVLWGPQHDAKCIVAWGGEEGTIVVCFRGTCSLKNMRQNLKASGFSCGSTSSSSLAGVASRLAGCCIGCASHALPSSAGGPCLLSISEPFMLPAPSVSSVACPLTCLPARPPLARRCGAPPTLPCAASTG